MSSSTRSRRGNKSYGSVSHQLLRKRTLQQISSIFSCFFFFPQGSKRGFFLSFSSFLAFVRRLGLGFLVLGTTVVATTTVVKLFYLQLQIKISRILHDLLHSYLCALKIYCINFEDLILLACLVRMLLVLAVLVQLCPM